ncbi:IS3 family transposase [Brevibacillus sp. HB1.2]|uniref:IS3 family transposase n=1 Tax=unclassified Brevibacillus TaxID=2684853 RepID=UPI000BBF5D8F|nr:hypothetical protein A616_10945 [Brevibacillus brevis X23]NTU20797.1 IS3 family transposase [Brevibacillus sp. HB1.2]NTU32539.1 IS3 family transposase [Brevibacillus sp. HB1.1]
MPRQLLDGKLLFSFENRSSKSLRRIEEYIHFYNDERLQLKLKKLTPSEFKRQLAA